MRVGAPGMATGAEVVPENCGALFPPAAGGIGAIGAPKAPVSTGEFDEGGWERAVGVATRVSCDAQAASNAKAGSSRSFDETRMGRHLETRQGL